jgi:hypothetical protein
MAGRTRIAPPAVAARTGFVLALRLVWTAVLPLICAGRILGGAILPGLAASVLVARVLSRPLLAGILMLLASMIAMAVAMLAIAACSLILLPVRMLGLALIRACLRLAFAVLIGPMAPFAHIPFPMRAAMMLPPGPLALGTFEPRLGTAEAPNLFEFRLHGFGPGAFALTGGQLLCAGSLSLSRGRNLIGSGRLFERLPSRVRINGFCRLFLRGRSGVIVCSLRDAFCGNCYC